MDEIVSLMKKLSFTKLENTMKPLKWSITAKNPYSENSVRRKFHTAKIPYGENSVQQKFRTAKIPTAKIPTANIPATL